VEEPPLWDWSRAEALREVLRVARGLDDEDFERDVLPRLRRLIPDQRRQVLDAMRATVDDAKRSGDWRPPGG
jgi:hypothetical protein